MDLSYQEQLTPSPVEITPSSVIVRVHCEHSRFSPFFVGCAPSVGSGQLQKFSSSSRWIILEIWYLYVILRECDKNVRSETDRRTDRHRISTDLLTQAVDSDIYRHLCCVVRVFVRRWLPRQRNALRSNRCLLTGERRLSQQRQYYDVSFVLSYLPAISFFTLCLQRVLTILYGHHHRHLFAQYKTSKNNIVTT